MVAGEGMKRWASGWRWYSKGRNPNCRVSSENVMYSLTATVNNTVLHTGNKILEVLITSQNI